MQAWTAMGCTQRDYRVSNGGPRVYCESVNFYEIFYISHYILTQICSALNIYCLPPNWPHSLNPLSVFFSFPQCSSTLVSVSWTSHTMWRTGSVVTFFLSFCVRTQRDYRVSNGGPRVYCESVNFYEIFYISHYILTQICSALNIYCLPPNWPHSLNPLSVFFSFPQCSSTLVSVSWTSHTMWRTGSVVTFFLSFCVRTAKMVCLVNCAWEFKKPKNDSRKSV